MHFYTEHTKFGEETGRFSDGGENSFLVTSLFCLSEDAKAFACQKGQIIVVPNVESNALVNVILKPIDNLDIRFRNVAYYVYRGIRKDSILQSDTEMLEPSGTATDLIDRIYSEADFDGAYSADIVGYSNDLTDEITIDSLFYDMDIKKMFVLEGEWFGTFNSDTSIGFEIVVDTEMCPLTVGILKQNSYSIVPSGTTDFERRMSRERILAFIDPVAFWGMHSEVGVQVAGQSHKIKKSDLSTTILSHFNNRSRVYIDIRSEWGYSYNVYGTYTDTLGNSIQVGTDKNNLIARTYETNGWPILWIENMDLTQKLYISLSLKGNSEPVLFLFPTKLSFLSLGTHFIDKILKKTSDENWTHPIDIKLNVHDDGLVMPCVYTMQYFKKKYSEVNNEEFFSGTKYCHNAFPPIMDVDESAEGRVFKCKYSSKYSYIKGRIQGDVSEYGYCATSGMAWDDDIVVFYSKSLFPHERSPHLLKRKKNDKLDGFVFGKGTFAPSELTTDISIIFEEYEEDTRSIIYCLHVYNTNDILPNQENLVILGVTREELSQIISLIEPVHNCYFYLQEVEHNNIRFEKYRIFIRYFSKNGVPDVIPTNVFVYSDSGLIFTSNDFSQQQNSVQKVVYTPEPEELRGTNKRFSQKNNQDFYIDSNLRIKKIVNDFIQDINKPDVDITSIEKAIKIHGEDLWSHSVTLVKKGNHDDRILYWARLKMMVALKQHSLFAKRYNFVGYSSQILDASELSDMVYKLDEYTRHYINISFTENADKRILLVGFDPILHKNTDNHNLSGELALYFHGISIEDDNGYIYEIQSMILPYRYTDLAEKSVVVKYICRLIREKRVDAIVNLDYKESVSYIDIDRIASKLTVDYPNDNNNYSGKISYKAPYGRNYYETNFPIEEMMNNENTCNYEISKQRLFFDQSYCYEMQHPSKGNTPNVGYKYGSIDDIIGNKERVCHGSNKSLVNIVFFQELHEIQNDKSILVGLITLPGLNKKEEERKPFTIDEIRDIIKNFILLL